MRFAAPHAKPDSHQLTRISLLKSHCIFKSIVNAQGQKPTTCPSKDDQKFSTKHIKEIERHLNRWENFWTSPKGKANLREGKLNVKSCERNHLEVFRRHLLNNSESPLKKQTVNKYMRSISQILIAAENNGLLKRRAKLERLPTDVLDPAEKLYLRDEQIDALMGAADKLTWPKFESSGLQPST